MNKEIIKSARIGEEYIKIKHKSGLTILLCPMAGYSSAYALFGTRYGSIDTTFKTVNDDDFVTVPEGIAHFLEHKLFENDEKDTFELFAKTGAECNAYTSFDKTAYLFSCTDKFKENLEILLKFVQEPYFTEETVQKEQGIIAQEIKMYQDSPGWRVFFNCLNGMYHSNPVKIDIAGTENSISKITADLLYRCYNTFYNLHNMVLSIAGNFNVDEALEICDKMLKPNENIELETIIPSEPKSVVKNIVVQKMSCSMPLFYIGFKFPNYEGSRNMQEFVRMSMLMEIAFGTTSDFFNKLYEEGLINDSFSASAFNGRGFFTPMIAGESRNSREVYRLVKEEIERLKIQGLPKADFDIIKKQTYGDVLKIFNNVRSVASTMLESEFLNTTLYDGIETVANTDFNDIISALQEIDAENSCLSIIEPLDK